MEVTLSFLRLLKLLLPVFKYPTNQIHYNSIIMKYHLRLEIYIPEYLSVQIVEKFPIADCAEFLRGGIITAKVTTRISASS